MINYLVYSAIAGLYLAFSLTLLHKLGIMNFLQAHAPNGVWYKLLSCNFCLGFWLSVIGAVIMTIKTGDINYIFTPILVAPIVGKFT